VPVLHGWRGFFDYIGLEDVAGEVVKGALHNDNDPRGGSTSDHLKGGKKRH